MSPAGEPLLRVEDLHVEFSTEDGVVKAVDGISYEVRRGRTLGVVGESGSGKTVSAMTILGLTRAQGAKITGRVMFEGRDLLALPDPELRTIRGNEIAMIFQDPSTALHPLYKVGSQLIEAVRATPSIRVIEGYAAEALLTEDGAVSGFAAADRTLEGAA